MDYYSILNLQREPFANSPDPAFFYPAAQHQGCLQQLELAIRLRRGLNVVIGDVGTGKTTLCRDLIRRFADEANMATYLMLDPGVSSDSALLSAVLALFRGRKPPGKWDADRKKEAIKQFLFDKGVAAGQTVTLIIDEGQKLSASSLEILREFLNYETNEHKLLQMVIFAQKEFQDMIVQHPNFADRINLRFDLHPLGLRDTMALIRYRIQVSGGESADRLFSRPAMVAIFLATRGYPRRIIHLCHSILLALIIQNRGRANWRLVRASARRKALARPAHPWRWLAGTGALALFTALVLMPGLGFWKSALTTPSSPATVGAPSMIQATAATRPPQENTAPEPFSIPGWHSAVRAAVPPIEMGAPPSASAAERPVPKPTFEAASADPLTQPARLGRIVIAPNETLGQLIQIVYGRFTPAALQAISAVNPHIADPNALNVGDVIHFPALPAAVRPLPVSVWWVQLAAYPRLDEAVRALKRRQAEGLAARLVPYWNPGQGLVFSLVLAECFYDRRSAESALRQTAFGVHQAGKICSLWRDDSVFFSNPFRAGTDIVANHF
jgi:general secretion pathway protein A